MKQEATNDERFSGKNRRRKRWVPGNLQLKIVLTTFLVAAILLLFNLQFSLMGLWEIYEQPADTVEGLLQQTQHMLLKQFLLIAVAAVFLSFWAGLTYFHLCGPIYRFRQYLLGLVDGRWNLTCHVRKGDHLQDMREAINSAVSVMAAGVRAQHEVLEEARAVLDELRGEAPDGAGVEELIRKIDEQAAEFRRRFGEDAAEAPPERLVEASAGAQSDPSTR